ncbi:hypothetical protein Droror1_Dr00002161 [Drosera rotundifolia]
MSNNVSLSQMDMDMKLTPSSIVWMKFYCNSIGKDKDKEKHVSGFKKHQQDGGPKAAANKRIQELMR